MSEEEYKSNPQYKDKINSEIRELAQKFLSGKAGVIEISRELAPYQTICGFRETGLAQTLLTFVGIDSETDALPFGSLREMWHPSTAHIEDEKIRRAEEHWRDYATAACQEILNFLK